MDFYTVLSLGYDLLDKLWFADSGLNPREVITQVIPNEKAKVLDMCCGTFTNGMTLAMENDQNTIYGVDISKSMLREGKRKIEKKQLTNARLRCCDATATGFRDKSFDYVIIGLVLHESTPQLRRGVLNEAYRVLKDDGKLVILEWEEEETLFKKIKFAPLHLMEELHCEYFHRFYYGDKEKYFAKYGFKVINSIHCNYSVVMELTKEKIDE